MLPFLSMALYTYRYAMAEYGQVYILARVLSERGIRGRVREDGEGYGGRGGGQAGSLSARSHLSFARVDDDGPLVPCRPAQVAVDNFTGGW